jgi:hypothetical protein
MTDEIFTLAPLFAPPSRIDVARSRELATEIDAQSDECFYNALSVLPSEPHALYVEGFVVSNSLLTFPKEHGWLQRLDGTIVDPDPSYRQDFNFAFRYFPVFFWTRDEVLSRFLHDGWVELPLRLSLPHEGDQHVTYRDAKLLAYRHCAAGRAARGVPMFRGDAQQFLRSVLGPYWSASPKSPEVSGYRAPSARSQRVPRKKRPRRPRR